MKWVKNCGLNTEKGFALIETLVSIAILGAVSFVLLGSLATTSKSTIVADDKTTAHNLLVSQMEWARQCAYQYETSSYPAAAIPVETDYTGYSAIISAQPISSPDGGVQKITVTIIQNDKQVVTLDSYKVKR